MIVWLNYLSISLAVVSTVILMFVKVEENKQANEQSENGIFERLSPKAKKFLGTFLSVFAGIMYALTYEPQT